MVTASHISRLTEEAQQADRKTLADGCDLFAVNTGRPGLSRLLIRYDHPFLFALKALEAQTLFQLLKSGTHNKELFRFVTSIEATGMMLSCYTNADSGTIEVVALDEQMPQVLPLIFEMIYTPALPAAEMERLRQVTRENWMIGRRQTQVVARERFMQNLFRNHPYGHVPGIDQIDALSVETLSELHRDITTGIQPRFFVATSDPDRFVAGLNSARAPYPNAFNNPIANGMPLDSHIEAPSDISRDHIPVPDTVQSAIRMGRKLFAKGHPDYATGKVATTILGGYFSSRLMANLREDKGYTYGAGAGMHMQAAEGYLTISAEVGTQHLDNALGEIHRELDRLRHEPPDAEELHTVKQYLRGSTLRQTDGPFNRLSLIAALNRHGLKTDFTEQYLRKLEKMTPEEILTFAIQWLNPDDFVTVTAGEVNQSEINQEFNKQ